MIKNHITIVQASDLHICQDGKFAYEVSDTLKGLKNFIRHIKKFTFPIDLLIISGDLSDDGTISSYEIIKENLSKLKIPYYIIPGNHDNKKNMATVFYDHKYLNNYIDNRIFHSFIIDNIKIILLDSVSTGEPHGSLTDGILEALKIELEKSLNSLVFLHQPPFPSGIGFMDNQPYLNREKLLKILNKAENLLLVGCGHIHRAMFSRKGGVNFSLAPSTAMQLDLDLNDIAPGDFVLETPGYLIHRINLINSLSPEISTHIVQITDRKEMEVTYPFND